MATTSVFLPGESHGQRSLMGYSLWGTKSWVQLKRLSMHACNVVLQTNSESPCFLDYFITLKNFFKSPGTLGRNVKLSHLVASH